MKKKMTILTIGVLAIAALGTMALSTPLAVRNGVVTDYTPGNSLTIRNGSLTQTYWLVPANTAAGQNAAVEIPGLGVGARVTVYGQCFGQSFFGRNVVDQGDDGDRRSTANQHICAAVSIVVNAAAPSASGAAATSVPTTMPEATPTP